MLKDRTANLLGALSLAIVDRMRAATEHDLGYGGEAPAALATIGHGPGQSNDALRQALGLTHSGTVRLIDRLQKEGLVERRPGRNKRTVALFLTASGEAARVQLLRKRGESLDPLIGLLSFEEVAALDVLLERMLKHIPTAPTDAYHICRLCNEVACGDCPMDRWGEI